MNNILAGLPRMRDRKGKTNRKGRDRKTKFQGHELQRCALSRCETVGIFKIFLLKMHLGLFLSFKGCICAMRSSRIRDSKLRSAGSARRLIMSIA